MTPLETKLTYIAAGAIILCMILVGIIAWIRSRAGSGGRQLKIWDGRIFIPVPLKPGQTQYLWKRPDNTSCLFQLDPAFGHPEGRRGMIWFGNGATGQFLKWVANEKRWTAVAKPTKVNNGAATALLAKTVDGDEPDRVDGMLMRIDFNHDAVFPDGNWHANAIQDTRERKWFEAQASVAEAPGKSRNMLLIGLGVLAALIFLPKLFGGG